MMRSNAGPKVRMIQHQQLRQRQEVYRHSSSKKSWVERLLGLFICLVLIVSFAMYSHILNGANENHPNYDIDINLGGRNIKLSNHNNVTDQQRHEKMLPQKVRIKGTNAINDGKHYPIPNLVSQTHFNKHVWKDLKMKLCPNMVPNIHLGPTIFSLARSEIGLHKFRMPLSMTNSSSHDIIDNEEEAQLQQQWNNGSFFFTKFFQRVKHGFMYKPSSSTTSNDSTNDEKKKNYKSVCYFAVWKAANDQIRKGTEKLFENSTGEFQRYASNKMDSSCCVITAIRDPISHFLSGYNEEEFRHNRNLQSKRLKSLYIPKYGSSRDAPYAQYDLGSPERFEQFVIDFLSGPYVSRGEYTHAHSMVGMLDWLHNNERHPDFRLTDYLPSLDNLLDRWPKFMYETCGSQVIPDFFQTTPLSPIKPHPSSHDGLGFYKAAKQVWTNQQETAKALCALHIMDYACFDKLPNGVPQLCQEVYSNPTFIETLLSGDLEENN